MRRIGIAILAFVALGFVLDQPADAGWRHHGCGGCYGVCDGWGCFGYSGLCAACYTPSYCGCGGAYASWSGCSTCCGGYSVGYGGCGGCMTGCSGCGDCGGGSMQPAAAPAPPSSNMPAAPMAAPSMPAASPPPAPSH